VLHYRKAICAWSFARLKDSNLPVEAVILYGAALYSANPADVDLLALGRCDEGVFTTIEAQRAAIERDFFNEWKLPLHLKWMSEKELNEDLPFTNSVRLGFKWSPQRTNL
jgi:hypothetical protein